MGLLRLKTWDAERPSAELAPQGPRAFRTRNGSGESWDNMRCLPLGRRSDQEELEPERRFELLTCALRVRCSTD